MHPVCVLLTIFTVSLVTALSPSTISKVDSLHNPSYRFHRSSQYIRTLLKYKITPTHPDSLPVQELISKEGRVLRKDVNLGLVPASFIQAEGFYQSQVTIGEGSDSRTFILDFDTGSADLWVFSTLLPSGQRGNHTLYNPAKSNTSVPLGKTWNITYLDTSGASGLAFSDTLSLGGLIVKNQAVEAANATESFSDCSCDGLLGLNVGTNQITPGVVPTTIQNLIQNPSFEQPVFTALLTRASEPPGFYTFGYINDTLSQPGVQFTNIVTIAAQAPGSWEFLSEYAFLNGKMIARPGNTAIADSGTTGILLDSGLVREIYELLGGHFNVTFQVWVYPENTTQFPALTLPAGDNNVTLTPADFVGGTADSGFIPGSIQENGNINVDIFGDSWLNNVYAVFDLGMTGPGMLRFGIVPRESGQMC